jgi:hypothetical protein
MGLSGAKPQREENAMTLTRGLASIAFAAIA